MPFFAVRLVVERDFCLGYSFVFRSIPSLRYLFAVLSAVYSALLSFANYFHFCFFYIRPSHICALLHSCGVVELTFS